MAREKAVVVGAGGISVAWFPPLKTEGVEVVGVVDLDIDTAKRRVDEFDLNCPVDSDLAAMLTLTEPDFVVDLTVPEAHGEVTCTALKAGCHVIGEKPMAASMADARRMVSASEQTGKLYMVSQSRRWESNHCALRQMIDSGGIGDVTTLCCDFFVDYHFRSFRSTMASPLILEMSIHHFDMARFFCRKNPLAVYAHEFNPAGSKSEGDASASCIFELTDGVVFTYRGSWCAKGCDTSWNGHWRVMGEKGTVLYDCDTPPRGQVIVGDSAPRREPRDLTAPAAPLEHGGQHGALREMLAYLRAGRLPQTECHDNIQSLAMVFGAIDSSRKGRRVETSV